MFHRGDSFAEAVVLQTMDFPVSAQVIAESRLLVIPADSFLRHLRSSTDLCFKVMVAMTHRLRSLVAQLKQSPAARRCSVWPCSCFGCATGSEGPCRIELPLDKHLIAARLGMQPETLSRGLTKLRTAGVEGDGAVLRVTNMARLRAIAVDGGSGENLGA